MNVTGGRYHYRKLTGSALLIAYWVLHLPQDSVTITNFKTFEIWLAILLFSSGWFVLGLHESSWTSLVDFFDLFMGFPWGRRGSSSSRRCQSSCSVKIRALSSFSFFALWIIWAVPLCVLLLALENLSCWWLGCWEMSGAFWSDSFLVFTGRLKVLLVSWLGQWVEADQKETYSLKGAIALSCVALKGAIAFS